MPSKSKKQRMAMAAACKSKGKRKKGQIPRKVACDFYRADQRQRKK